MHMRNALIVTDDVHTRAWLEAALADSDVQLTSCAPAELPSVLMKRGADLVLVDGSRDCEAPLRTLEQVASGGLDVRLVLVVDAGALTTLRLPVGMPCDFFVRGGSGEELAARVRNLLWPGEEVSDNEVVRVENLALNLATYQAHIDGVPVDFTYLEYALFAFLVTHPGRTYSREMLLQRVWGSDYYGGSRTVDVHIRRIRAKIGHELSRHLETVRNVGYLWTA